MLKNIDIPVYLFASIKGTGPKAVVALAESWRKELIKQLCKNCSGFTAGEKCLGLGVADKKYERED